MMKRKASADYKPCSSPKRFCKTTRQAGRIKTRARMACKLEAADEDKRTVVMDEVQSFSWNGVSLLGNGPSFMVATEKSKKVRTRRRKRRQLETFTYSVGIAYRITGIV